MFQYLRKNLHLLVKKFLKYDSIVKPLSHQGGALAGSTIMQNAEVSAVQTPTTPWQRGGNSVERRGKS